MRESRWPLEQLSKACTVNPRLLKPHRIADDHVVSFVPMAAVDEVAGTITNPQARPFAEVKKGFTHFEDGDVLFAKITPCMENGKAAIARELLGGHGFGSTEFHVIRPQPHVLPQWVFYFIRRQSFRAEAKRNFTGTAGQQRVPTTFMWSVLLPVPPLEEQRRIVDILSRAEGVLRLRREAQKKAAELIPALFLDMFGDPATNPKGWLVARIGDLCNVQTGATPSRKRPEYYDGDVCWVKTAEVAGGAITCTEEHISELAIAETNCKIFPVGTILVAMYGQGQTRGRSAVLKIQAASNQACAAILPSNNIIGEFLFCFLQTQYEELRGLAHGGNQPNLNLSMVKTYQVILPPVGFQAEFVKRIEHVRSVQAQQSVATQKAEATFDALLAGAFNGVLPEHRQRIPDDTAV